MADILVMSTHAQSQVPVAFIVFERFSVDRLKRYENSGVDVNILLQQQQQQFFVFAEMKTETFENALVWIGP